MLLDHQIPHTTHCNESRSGAEVTGDLSNRPENEPVGSLQYLGGGVGFERIRGRLGRREGTTAARTGQGWGDEMMRTVVAQSMTKKEVLRLSEVCAKPRIPGYVSALTSHACSR